MNAISSRQLLSAYRDRLEAAYERGFRNVVDLEPQLRSLPLLIQCAVRVHRQREARPVRVFTLDPRDGRIVVVAHGQGVVLLFSSRGALDAAGVLIASPEAPIASGGRWTRIAWTEDVTRHDWY